MSLMVQTIPCTNGLPDPFSLFLRSLQEGLSIPSLPFSSFPLRLLITILSCPLLSFPLCPRFLRIVFPPSSFPLSQLLSVSLSISSFLFSHFLLDRPRSFLITLQSHLLLFPTSFVLCHHFLRVRIPPSFFLRLHFLPVRIPPSFFLRLDFLPVRIPPFSFVFPHFLPVGLLLFPQFLPVFLPPFSFVFPHFLWVGFLPLPGSFQLSTFRFLLLSSSIGTRLALNVTCRCLPPLKSIQIHLTLHTGQRSQHHTQALPFSPSFSSLGIQSLPILIPPAFQKLSTFLRILVGHRDKNTHASPNTLAIFIDPLDQSATSTQALSTPYLGGGYPPPPTPSDPPIATT